MIYDCFTFYNELDILEMRLEELYPVVDKFIIVEGSLTFQGNPKPQFGWDNSERFEKYADKISWCHVNHGWPGGRDVTAWDREAFQRNKIKDFLNYDEMNPDDVVIISDVDEIPRRADIEYVLNLMPNVNVMTLGLGAYFYALNVRAPYEHDIKLVRWGFLEGTTPQEIRKSPPHFKKGDAGWHFSYVGDLDFIMNKLNSYSHTEFKGIQPRAVELALTDHRAFWTETQFETVEVDETWQHAVKNNPDKWTKHICR